jgi:formylmethanofuran dehydrogenase subunit E-like metal-binding protein
MLRLTDSFINTYCNYDIVTNNSHYKTLKGTSAWTNNTSGEALEGANMSAGELEGIMKKMDKMYASLYIDRSQAGDSEL